MKAVDFFKTDFVNFGSYDNFRKIASYIDNCGPSSRKCIYTLLKKNVSEPKKLADLKSIISQYTSYIHGNDSLVGVLVNLARNYVGSNNIPLIKRKGNFGSRLITSPAADRYIFSCKEGYLDLIFNKEDMEILIKQEFEGNEIEPKFFVPLLPLILINGNEGLSTGFAQKIFPRNPLEIKERILQILNDEKNLERIYPWYNGFNGIVVKRNGENLGENSFETRGKFEVESNKIVISELPIGYDLKSYREILESLLEKKIINYYSDLSDTKKDTFLFEVKMKTKDLTSDQIYDKLKLIKRDTENFTTVDENNKIRIFQNEIDLLQAFVKIKLEYYQKRKDFKVQDIENDILILKNKLLFIRYVIENKIKINKVPKKDIENSCQENELDKIESSYDYLLRMPIYSLTTEKLEDLMQEYKAKKVLLEEIKNKDIKEWYKNDLESFFRRF